MNLNDFNKELTNYIEINGGLTSTSKSSDTDMLQVGQRIRGRVQPGKMYTFRYFTPDEPWFDTQPVIIGLTDLKFPKNQVGLNLHYMPYDVRIRFLRTLIRSYSSIFAVSANFDRLPRNQYILRGFAWQNIVPRFSKEYNLKHCIHQYRLDRMKSPYAIGYEYWYVGASNNEDKFYGITMKSAQDLYYRNI